MEYYKWTQHRLFHLKSRVGPGKLKIKFLVVSLGNLRMPSQRFQWHHRYVTWRKIPGNTWTFLDFFSFFFHFNPLTIGNCYRRNWSQHGGCHSTRPLASTMLTHCCSAKVYCYLQKLIYFASKMNYEENMFLNEYMWTVSFFIQFFELYLDLVFNIILVPGHSNHNNLFR